MDYQELYSKYQAALNFRELNNDKNFLTLKDFFKDKILSNISFSSQSNILPYLAGIKEVFSFVENEAANVNLYRDQLDNLFSSDY